MSKRITGKWTETTTEAFGDDKRIQRGIKAEKLYYNYAKENYFKVIHHDSDRDKQNQGIDFEVWQNNLSKSPIGIDVKGTLFSDGAFVVENSPEGWIRNPKKKNDKVVHLNTEDMRAIEYDRESMIRYLDEVVKSEDELVWLQWDDFDFYDLKSKYPLVYRKFWIC